MTASFPKTGEVFESRYRVGPAIGSGGFAHVYRATQIDLGREVALKILTPTGGDAGNYSKKLIDRFAQEARLVSKLRDPHTITMFDYGQSDDGLLYMVFEFVNGTSLSENIKRHGKMAPNRVAKVLKQVLMSLEEAHALGVMHRDIKPGNIMVFEHVGRADQVKLLDFGIAKLVGSNVGRDLTADGALIGTPRYMSPEQIRGEAITAQSDIYSLGLVAFEMLEGRKAIESNSSVTIIGKQLDPKPFFVPRNPAIPEGLRLTVNRMLAKDRDVRFLTANEVLEALEHWDSDEVVAGGEDMTLRPATIPGRGPNARGPESGSFPLDQRPTDTYERMLEEPRSTASSSMEWSGEIERRSSKPLFIGIGVVALSILVLLLFQVVNRGGEINAHQADPIASAEINNADTKSPVDAPTPEPVAVAKDEPGKGGTIRLSTQPTELEVFINGKSVGKSPQLVDVHDFPANIRVRYRDGSERRVTLDSYQSVLEVDMTDIAAVAARQEDERRKQERKQEEERARKEAAASTNSTATSGNRGGRATNTSRKTKTTTTVEEPPEPTPTETKFKGLNLPGLD